MKTTGNTILLTGGGSGIGRALAQAFHDRGDRVIVAGGARPRCARRRRGATGSHWLDLRRDRRRLDPRPRGARAGRAPRPRRARQQRGHHAGRGPGPRDAGTSPSAEAIVATNLLGPMRLTAALMPHLLARPRAAIVNVTSGLAFVPLAHTPAYSATKAGLHSWTQSLRRSCAAPPSR